MNLLIRYIKKIYIFTIQNLSSLLKREEIIYNLLWAIFKLKIFVYSIYLKTDKPQYVIFDAGEEKIKINEIKYFSLDCCYLNFDNELIDKASTQLEIVQFYRLRYIHTLKIFSFDYHFNKSDITKSLINCSWKFCLLNNQYIHHCCSCTFFKI